MKSQSSHFSFQKWNQHQLENFLSTRNGETKIGTCLTEVKKAKYVILGVKESVGPRANKGRSGAENGFDAFLSVFLNMQSNESLTGENVAVLGAVECLQEVEVLSAGVKELDEMVLKIISEHLNDSQIPILIGGGHNNAFPLMRYVYEQGKAPLHVVNLDAHADYRLLEGRHSGNSFSYAYDAGYLEKYYVFGLHKRYNSQQIIDDLRKHNHCFTFEDEYLLEPNKYTEDFKKVVATLKEGNKPVGIELDLDVIENMPSSASTPVGVSISTARNYIRIMANQPRIAYVHFPEGAPTNIEQKRIVGKTLAYLVCDFISIHGDSV